MNHLILNKLITPFSRLGGNYHERKKPLLERLFSCGCVVPIYSSSSVEMTAPRAALTATMTV